MSVLPRLIALPASSGVTLAQRQAWTAHLAALPPLPLDPAKPNGVSATKVAPVGSGSWKRVRRGNSENTGAPLKCDLESNLHRGQLWNRRFRVNLSRERGKTHGF